MSQVNPHVHLFFYAARGSVGRPVSHLYGEGWRGGFLLSSIEQFLKLELSKWLKVLRDLELLPRLMNQDWSNLWLQKFDGHVTILPKSGLSDWLHLLTDPDENRMRHCLTVGERQTFPKLHMIANRMRIEQMIAQCRTEIKERLDLKSPGRSGQDTVSGMLSEDSETTVRARMNTFEDVYHSRDKGEHSATMGYESRRRSNRPSLRHTLGRESVGDYSHLKATDYSDNDHDDDDGYGDEYDEDEDDEDDEDDEGMDMENDKDDEGMDIEDEGVEFSPYNV